MTYALIEKIGSRLYVMWSDFPSLADCKREAIEQWFLADGHSQFICSLSSMV